MLLFRILSAAVVAASVYVSWTPASNHTAAHAERKVIYYQDSMHPWIKSSQAGKCTVCNMDLTPIYEGENGFQMTDGLVQLPSNSITVLNVQTEPVKNETLTRVLRVAGTLDALDTAKTIISAPAPGRIDAVEVDHPGIEVEKGRKLVTLFSPELVQKRVFLRSVAGNQSAVGNGLVQSTESTFSGELLAPRPGVVLERYVYTGQYVVEGEKLLALADASVLWFRFDVYERDLPLVSPGQTIEITTPAVPGKKFAATIAFIEPTINDSTRTVKVGATVKNPTVGTNGSPQRLLRFGMSAEGRVRFEVKNALSVPRSAILFPGGAAYAYVQQDNGVYERRRVRLGRQGEDRWEVLDGLDQGDRVVTSGNVLIDAQAHFAQSSAPEAAETAESTPAEDSVVSVIPAAMPMSEHDSAMHEESESHHPVVPTVAKIGEQSTNQSQAASKPVVDKLTTHRKVEINRMTTKDELRQKRSILMTEGRNPNSTNYIGFSNLQYQSIDSFIVVACRISEALAADDLGRFNAQMTNLPNVVQGMANQTENRWKELTESMLEASKKPAAKDLKEARQNFLPLSTATVDLVKQLKSLDPSFSKLKVFHCPMAPKPGLWIQAKGPLANPYYGAEMLTCGEEIRQ